MRFEPEVGSHFGSDQRQRLSELLNDQEDIFTPGGEPTSFALHRIDTGDATRITNQQRRRKIYADRGRQPAPSYKIGDLVLVSAHVSSNVDKGVTHNLKLSNSYLARLEIQGTGSTRLTGNKSWYISLLIIFLILSGRWIYNELNANKACLIDVPTSSKVLFRPPEDCSMCIEVNDVVRLSNVSVQDFEEYHAYSATPVIVTDATEGWKAIEEFNFNFFANFYSRGKMGKQINDCFYFAYKSGLNSLQEVFGMSEERANLSGEPWYVGWSTCYDEETRNLRSYYNRPYFLPRTAESDMVDWIFMGGPGQGAHMHVDSVKHMSWQAQIRGSKQWELAPPPECLYDCSWITFVVKPGEILVVDTNRWYHKTNVLPGEISITIGAEYD
ncbi:hypothetical protein K1T71_005815 [Dendrolimus kikuchii]|uniref:Uncharacterized protein n=1 Tax=Dendrolimus kikuchii TaxID=765133 RepID=A0ACC1D5A3_9NEOP|nr:hypothetical protein K1T71_005815 [Dendrolimus kikuchii]